MGAHVQRAGKAAREVAPNHVEGGSKKVGEAGLVPAALLAVRGTGRARPDAPAEEQASLDRGRTVRRPSV
ncbi:hypothetical protein SPHINGOT1_260308 [Sphingomonas sp. T1]|nr:hypothetical protein SPHINGOT1_260308 [Sphingomonas sp. T1]